jgi:membrane-associated protein
MIPGMSIFEFITWAGVLGVAFVIFAETGFLIGFLLPGDSLLLTAGLLTHQKVLDINIHFFVIILFIAAILGNNSGYAIGKHAGRRLFKRKDSLIFHQSNLQKAEKFYEKHGNKAVVLACFVPFARTFVPLLAGVSKMKHSTFILFNTIGILLWAVGLTYVGYYAGAWLESKGIDVDHYLLPFIALIVLVSALPPLYHIFKDKGRRQAAVHTAKHTFRRRKP